MNASLQEEMRGETEPLPGIGLNNIEFHNGKGYYYVSSDHTLSLNKRTFKCVREQCNVTARMEPGLGCLVDDGSHSHEADIAYRDKCVLLQIIRERFLKYTLPPRVILQEVLDTVLGAAADDENDLPSAPQDDSAPVLDHKEDDEEALMKEESQVGEVHFESDIQEQNQDDEDTIVKEELQLDVEDIESDSSYFFDDPLDDPLKTHPEETNPEARKRLSRKRKNSCPNEENSGFQQTKSLNEIPEILKNLLGEKEMSSLYMSNTLGGVEKMKLMGKELATKQRTTADFKVPSTSSNSIHLSNVVALEVRTGSNGSLSSNRQPDGIPGVSKEIIDASNNEYTDDGWKDSMYVISASESSEWDNKTVAFEWTSSPVTGEEIEPLITDGLGNHETVQPGRSNYGDNSHTEGGTNAPRASVSDMSSHREPLVVGTCTRAPKRVYDRRDCCIFCYALVTNFTRHLRRNHADETEVAKILAKPKGGKERRMLFEELKKKGNFFHNQICLKEKRGTIIVANRPRYNMPVSKYRPCKMCLGFFSKEQMYKHRKRCHLKPVARGCKDSESRGSPALTVPSEEGSECGQER